MMILFKRIAIYLSLWILVIGVFQITTISAKINAKTKTQISDGINNWLQICETIPKNANNPLFQLVGKMAKFLSVSARFMSFIAIFSPQDDCQELKMMKQTFTKSNVVLDNITIQLNHSEELLKGEVQRDAYFSSVEEITYSYHKLNDFFDELEIRNCLNHTNCSHIGETKSVNHTNCSHIGETKSVNHTNCTHIRETKSLNNTNSTQVGEKSFVNYANCASVRKTNSVNFTNCTHIREINCVSHTRENLISRYVKYFDVQYHLNMILSGAISKAPFNESLLDLIRDKYSCDVGKLEKLANGILKLAFKAQLVKLTYEQLNGSKESVVHSIKTWLNSVYVLREYTHKLKKECFDDIENYMLADIKNSKYQTTLEEDEKTSDALRLFMKEKYTWLDWNVYTYNAFGGDHYYIFNLYGDFWNSPKEKAKAKRNIVVSLIDKAGTYEDQAYWIWNAINDIARDSVCEIGCADNLVMLLNMIMIEMKKKNVWNYILSLIVLRESVRTVVRADDPLTFIDRNVTFKEQRSSSNGEPVIADLSVRLLITVKSLEMDEQSDASCNDHGQSIALPYSSGRECQCKPDFNGEYCQEHSKNGIASTIDALIATTLQQPTLESIFQDAIDLRENIGLGNVDSEINDLRSALKTAYDRFGKGISQEFSGSNLNSIYSKSVQLIQYYNYRFNNLQNSADVESEGKKLAEAVLGTEGVREWLYNLNELFMGNTITSIGARKPFMIKTIDNNIDRACSKQYKRDVDNAYRQFVILQLKGYIIWAQALEILEMNTDIIAKTYQRRLETQNSLYTELTCQYAITGSITIQCSGGRYIHPKVILTNICKVNYYWKGENATTCVNKSSTCEPCSCYPPGSEGLECADQSGKCKCLSGFYGDKCENRDCVWSSWSSFSNCSKICGYGGTQYKSRYLVITRSGKGTTCAGNSRIFRSCFDGCCSYQFHCSDRKKCVPYYFKCDYEDDCGDGEDERDSSCQESCFYRYTDWDTDGWGWVYYLDRHRVDCGGSEFVLQMFHLERYASHSKIRYKYRCCRLNRDIASAQYHSNSGTYTTHSSVYLDRQDVSCPHDSYLNDFHLFRPSGNKLSYTYCCNKLDYSSHRSRQYCISSTTSSTVESFYNYYLDRQTVDCRNHGNRYFLNRFHLKRTGHGYWYYEYTCCTISRL